MNQQEGRVGRKPIGIPPYTLQTQLIITDRCDQPMGGISLSSALGKLLIVIATSTSVVVVNTLDTTSCAINRAICRSNFDADSGLMRRDR